jgi:hypothetical protein
MKLKVLKREHKEVETDLDLPVYVYLQDEFSNDEIIKITEKGKVTVKFDFSEVVISVDTNFFVEEHWLSNITTEEHFNELYTSALDYINSKL